MRYCEPNEMYRTTAWIIPVLFAGLTAACAPDQPVQAPPPASVSEAEYLRAERMLGPNTAPLLSGHIAAHYWQENDQLVYRRSDLGAQTYVLFDPAPASGGKWSTTASREDWRNCLDAKSIP